MSGEMVFTVFILVAAMLAVLIAKLASFLHGFSENTQHICYKMDHAAEYGEYCRLRRELRCHYLCLIPFVNKKNVLRLYNRIYHRADISEKKERKDSLIPLMLPSALGIFMCVVCMCGMTWSWYTANIETPTQKMTAAYYEVTVDSVKSGDDEITVENGGYNLVADTPYTVTLKASGSVKECGGYCLIENTVDGEKIYTQNFKPEQTITITLIPTKSGIYTFTGVWGSHPIGVTEKDIITASTADIANNAIDDQNTFVTDDTPSPVPAPAESGEDQTLIDGKYTVQSGDTLAGIAEKYHTSVEKLQAYNGIANPNHITSGTVLNIPPQDYVIPESEPVTNETEHPVTEPVAEPTSEPVTDAPVVIEPSDATYTPDDSSVPTEPFPSEEE